MTEYLYAPYVELGPPRPQSRCLGVLAGHLDMKSKEFYRRCSECGGEVDRMPAQQKMNEAVKNIERALAPSDGENK